MLEFRNGNRSAQGNPNAHEERGTHPVVPRKGGVFAWQAVSGVPWASPPSLGHDCEVGPIIGLSGLRRVQEEEVNNRDLVDKLRDHARLDRMEWRCLDFEHTNLSILLQEAADRIEMLSRILYSGGNSDGY